MVKNKKSSKFYIFRCAADKSAAADTALSAYILREGKEQAKTGVFTTLNDILLRNSNVNAESLYGRTQNLVWKVPNRIACMTNAEKKQFYIPPMHESSREIQNTKSIEQVNQTVMY